MTQLLSKYIILSLHIREFFVLTFYFLFFSRFGYLHVGSKLRVSTEVFIVFIELVTTLGLICYLAGIGTIGLSAAAFVGTAYYIAFSLRHYSHEWKERNHEHKQKSYVKIIKEHLKKGQDQPSLSERGKDILFNAIYEVSKCNVHGLKHIEQLEQAIACLNPEQKIALLTLKMPGYNLLFLAYLSQDNENLPLLKVLFEGLSSKESIDVIRQASDFNSYHPFNHNYDKENSLAINFLTENGLIEVCPELLEKILQIPNVNITPYRNKLKASLKEVKHLHPIENLVCDYLVGELKRREEDSNPRCL